MSLTAGAFYALALLLGGAGVAKFVRPETVAQALSAAKLPGVAPPRHLPDGLGRMAGAAEIVLASAAIAFGNRATASLVAFAYLVFAFVAWRLLTAQAGRQPCGCFGEASTPVHRTHLALNVTAVATCVAAAISPPGTILDVGHGPWAGAPFLLATATLAWVVYLAFTALPALAEARSTAERQTHTVGDAP